MDKPTSSHHLDKSESEQKDDVPSLSHELTKEEKDNAWKIILEEQKDTKAFREFWIPKREHIHSYFKSNLELARRSKELKFDPLHIKEEDEEYYLSRNVYYLQQLPNLKNDCLVILDKVADHHSLSSLIAKMVHQDKVIVGLKSGRKFTSNSTTV